MRKFERNISGLTSSSYFCGGISSFFGYRLDAVHSNRLIIIAN
ncbi:MAG: hypothetical protein Q4E74_04340 [Ruminococcus sp.]|nr:hypothetical protein [Ruminococcus sp.]